MPYSFANCNTQSKISSPCQKCRPLVVVVPIHSAGLLAALDPIAVNPRAGLTEGCVSIRERTEILHRTFASARGALQIDLCFCRIAKRLVLCSPACTTHASKAGSPRNCFREGSMP